MAFQRTARRAKLRLVVDKDNSVEVGNETIEWRICLGCDILQFVVAGPEGKERKSDDHRVCQS